MARGDDRQDAREAHTEEDRLMLTTEELRARRARYQRNWRAKHQTHAPADWLDTRAVAARLGVSRQRVDEFRRTGRLRAIGHRARGWRFLPASVENLRDERIARGLQVGEGGTPEGGSA